MSETTEHENNIALAWYEGKYTQEQAQVSCELQGINFENVVNEYGRLYESDQTNSSTDHLLNNILNIEDRYYHGSN